MLVDNLYNTWDNDNINDFWLNNKIIDCASIDSICEINNNKKKKSNIQFCNILYDKSCNKFTNYKNNKKYNNTNIINNINIKKLNNNNYTSKSIYNYGNYTKDQEFKRKC
jgi:hypothetical protein